MLRFDHPTATMRERAVSVLVATLLQALAVRTIGIGEARVFPILERALVPAAGEQVVHFFFVPARPSLVEARRRNGRPTRAATERPSLPNVEPSSEPEERETDASRGAVVPPPDNAPLVPPDWRGLRSDTARRAPAGSDLGHRLKVAVDASVDSTRRASASTVRTLTWTLNAGRVGAFGVSLGRIHLGRLVLPFPVSLVSIRSVDPAYRAQNHITNEMRRAFENAARDSIIADAIAGVRKRASERAEAAGGRYRP